MFTGVDLFTSDEVDNVYQILVNPLNTTLVEWWFDVRHKRLATHRMCRIFIRQNDMCRIFILLYTLFLTTTTCNAESWIRHHYHRDIYFDDPLVNMNDFHDQTAICGNTHSNCENMQYLCKDLKIVRDKCKGTCGLCEKSPSPPNTCQTSKYGCCWDNVTASTGENKEGCPPCEDKHTECRYFADVCHLRGDIRLICPVTCRTCEPCLDSVHQGNSCSKYKRYDFCKISPDLMIKICKRTCGFCAMWWWEIIF